MIQKYKQLWKQKTNFSGMTSPREFFQGLLLLIGGSYVLFIPFLGIFAILSLILKAMGLGGSSAMIFVGAMAIIYLVLVNIPIFALISRRMNDSHLPKSTLIAILILLPVIGVFFVGWMNQTKQTSGPLSKIGHVLLMVGLGANLWSLIIFRDVSFLQTVGLIMMVIGLFVGYIGAKIDEKRN